MKQILKAVIDRLEPLGLPVYTTVPINAEYPHIHISEITASEDAVRDYFVYSGSVTVALHYKGQSTDYALTLRDEMRLRLKRYKTDSPPQVSKWTLYYDIADGYADESGYNYNAAMVFNYTYKAKKSYYDRVDSDGGDVEGLNCIIDEI